MIPFENSFVILGGYTAASTHSTNLKIVNTVASFNSIDSTWTNLGTLQKGRASHSVIQLGEDIFLVGGYSAKDSSSYSGYSSYSAYSSYSKETEMEVCQIKKDTITCTLRQPSVSYGYYVGLAIVPQNFTPISTFG